MATTDNSWMPAKGKHPVSIGSSLGRALKARKGAPPAKRANLPDRDFFSFRYNFMPESIDSSKPGTIDIQRGSTTSVTVERPTQGGESHVFKGSENSAKEWDCVLIYDEETGTFTLEKLESYMVLSYDKKTANHNRPSASPLPPPPQPSTSKAPFDDLDLDLEAQLERDLEEDADGEVDEDPDDLLVKIEEEEEEEEEVIIPPRAPSPPKIKPQRPTKPAQPPPKLKANPAKGKGKPKREQIVDIEEESFDFPQLVQNTKRTQPSPPEGLSFPGTFAAPSPLAAPPTEALPASDSEEDWDEVAATVPAPESTSQHEIYMDEVDDEEGEGEEIDMTAFEAEMNQHLGEEEDEEEDFLAAAVGSEIEPPLSGRPMSLNQFAAGEASQDEDDYSSSDSDDE